MATRDQILELQGTLAAIRSKLADLAASERPGDARAQAVLVTRLAEMDEALTLALHETGVAPADGGISDLLGLGASAPRKLGGIMTRINPPSYENAVYSERLSAVADLYYYYQMERLGMFRAVQKLKELFRAGQLRIGEGQGAIELYRFDRREVLRYTRTERMQAFRRVFGYTKATPPRGARSNDPFHGLLGGFAKRVAQQFRDKRIAETFKGQNVAEDASFGSVAVTRRAGLDLRSNLHNASYGDVQVLTVELSQVVADAFAILEARDVRHQFGTNDGWDTLEEVLKRHLGEQPHVSQRSRLAETGRNIIRWLGESHIKKDGADAFENLLRIIAEDCEEWITSSDALSRASAGKSGLAGNNVVPLTRKRA